VAGVGGEQSGTPARAPTAVAVRQGWKKEVGRKKE
jgi:hypothetical protein